MQRLNYHLDPKLKHRHVQALIKLSSASGLYPDCMALKGIELEEDPVAGGGFGEVHKGRLEGRHIAVKVLRVYQRSDIAKLLKVIYIASLHWASCLLTQYQGILSRSRYVATVGSSQHLAILWHLSFGRNLPKTMLSIAVDGKWQFSSFSGGTDDRDRLYSIGK